MRKGIYRLFSSFKGLSYVEAAISLPILLVSIFGIIDLAFYGYAWVVLNYAAYEAADLASKSTIEIDTTEAACVANPLVCKNYTDTVANIVDTAYKIAKIVAVDPGNHGFVELYNNRMYNSAVYTGAPWVEGWGELQMDSPVAFMRPGELVQYTNADNILFDFQNESRGFGSNFNQGWPNPAYRESWRELFQLHPGEILIRAKYTSPFFGIKKELEAKQFFFRRAPEILLANASQACGDGICDIDELCNCPADCATACVGAGGTGGIVGGSGGTGGIGGSGGLGGTGGTAGNGGSGGAGGIGGIGGFGGTGGSGGSGGTGGIAGTGGSGGTGGIAGTGGAGGTGGIAGTGGAGGSGGTGATGGSGGIGGTSGIAGTGGTGGSGATGGSGGIGGTGGSGATGGSGGPGGSGGSDVGPGGAGGTGGTAGTGGSGGFSIGGTGGLPPVGGFIPVGGIGGFGGTGGMPGSCGDGIVQAALGEQCENDTHCSVDEFCNDQCKCEEDGIVILPTDPQPHPTQEPYQPKGGPKNSDQRGSNERGNELGVINVPQHIGHSLVPIIGNSSGENGNEPTLGTGQVINSTPELITNNFNF